MPPSPDASKQFDELPITLRPLEGAKCADCKRPVGIIQVNGHTVFVAPKAVIIAGGTFLFSLHLCPNKSPESEEPKRNGRKPR